MFEKKQKKKTCYLPVITKFQNIQGNSCYPYPRGGGGGGAHTLWLRSDRFFVLVIFFSRVMRVLAWFLSYGRNRTRRDDTEQGQHRVRSKTSPARRSSSSKVLVYLWSYTTPGNDTFIRTYFFPRTTDTVHCYRKSLSFHQQIRSDLSEAIPTTTQLPVSPSKPPSFLGGGKKMSWRI